MIDTGENLHIALTALCKAWTKVCKDYDNRKLNSERSLQASLYFHLRTELGEESGHDIYIEAMVVRDVDEMISPDEASKVKKKRIAIDTLVCKDKEILIAMELKYSPRGFPIKKDIQKDLASLSRIHNHREKTKRATIHLVRHHTTKVEGAIRLKIHPDAKLLLGIVCSKNAVRAPARGAEIRAKEKEFWKTHRPDSNDGAEPTRWAKNRRELPRRLGLCIGYAPDSNLNSSATPEFWGQPFSKDTLSP